MKQANPEPGVPFRSTRAPEVRHTRIPKGYPGTVRTVAQMIRLILQGRQDVHVRKVAIRILESFGVPAKDYAGEISAIFRWVQTHIRYTKDPFRLEVLHSPRKILELRAGDCDDMSILLAALLQSVGHPVRIALAGKDVTRPDRFTHVYVQARHGDRWVDLDATMPYPPGWSPPVPVKRFVTVHARNADRALRETAANDPGPQSDRDTERHKEIARWPD